MGLKARIAAIEFAGDEVRVALISPGGKRPKVIDLRACRAEYGEEDQRFEALVAAVKTALEPIRPHVSAWALCVSGVHSVVRSLHIPFRGKRRVAAVAPSELEPYLALPIEEFVVDFCPVLEVDRQTDVFAVGVRRAVIEEQLAVLKAAGIDAEGVGVDALGLTALWLATKRGMKGLNAVLHVREDGSTLAITHNKKLVYFRHLSITEGQFHERARRVAREVQNSLRGFLAGWRGEGEVASLTVTGTQLREDEQELFEKDLDLPVSQEGLLAQLDCARLVERAEAARTPDEDADSAQAESLETAEAAQVPVKTSSCWESLIGVAMGAAGAPPFMNFRKEGLTWKNTFPHVVGHLVLSSCLALLLLVTWAWYYHDGRATNIAEAARLRSQVETLLAEVEELQSQGVVVPIEMFTAPSLLDILKEIGAKMPDANVGITELRVERADTEGAWLTILGEVRDDAKFAAVLEDAKKSTLFRVEETERELEEGKSTFRITARRTEPAPAAS